MKLLDTDHCIAILRGQLDINAHVPPQEELGTTAISVAELTHGAHRSLHKEDNLAKLEVLLSVLVILPFDEAAGRKFGELKAELEARGEPLDQFDLQIASIAIENDCELLTINNRHFSRIGSLHLENWLT
jgi:predicted nucleic acid-binding protein